MNTTKVNSLKLDDPSYPVALKQLSGSPKQLFWQGAQPSDWMIKPRVAVVGSRKISPYGKHITSQLAGQLAGFGVVIISGLAYGVDAVAHQAALDAGGVTVAVLPTDLARIYPAAHYHLANNIIKSGGTLLSEYPLGAEIYKENFIARNRIVSGLSDVLVITEAAIDSGSMHTARFALEQGRTVMAVPGNINNPTSQGTNNLIKSGAVPVTSADDVLFALGINPKKVSGNKVFRGSPQEEAVLELIKQGVASQEELALASQLDAAALTTILTTLEINAQIRPQGGGFWITS